jgi:hypothetical protein
MGLAGRMHVTQNFNRESVVAAYLEEIQRLLNLPSKIE